MVVLTCRLEKQLTCVSCWIMVSYFHENNAKKNAVVISFHNFAKNLCFALVLTAKLVTSCKRKEIFACIECLNVNKHANATNN